MTVVFPGCALQEENQQLHEREPGQAPEHIAFFGTFDCDEQAHAVEDPGCPMQDADQSLLRRAVRSRF